MLEDRLHIFSFFLEKLNLKECNEKNIFNKDFYSDIKEQIITKQISDYTKTVRGKLNFE